MIRDWKHLILAMKNISVSKFFVSICGLAINITTNDPDSWDDGPVFDWVGVDISNINIINNINNINWSRITPPPCSYKPIYTISHTHCDRKKILQCPRWSVLTEPNSAISPSPELPKRWRRYVPNVFTENLFAPASASTMKKSNVLKSIPRYSNVDH